MLIIALKFIVEKKLCLIRRGKKIEISKDILPI